MPVNDILFASGTGGTPDETLIAVARINNTVFPATGAFELYSQTGETVTLKQTLSSGAQGALNGNCFSKDGTYLVQAVGTTVSSGLL